MFSNMMIGEIVAIISPLIALQLGLAAFCVWKILREGVANLNKPLWILITALVNIIGPIAFLVFGKRKDR